MERFKQLCSLAKFQKRCIGCMQPVPPTTHRARVVCGKPECAKEYQNLYYYHVTKEKRESALKVLSPEQRADLRQARKLAEYERERAAEIYRVAGYAYAEAGSQSDGVA